MPRFVILASRRLNLGLGPLASFSSSWQLPPLSLDKLLTGFKAALLPVPDDFSLSIFLGSGLLSTAEEARAVSRLSARCCSAP